jgi:hypothetical protein
MKTILLLLLTLSLTALAETRPAFTLITTEGKQYPGVIHVKAVARGLVVQTKNDGARQFFIPANQLGPDEVKRYKSSIMAAFEAEKTGAQAGAAERAKGEQAAAMKAASTFEVTMRNGTVHRNVVGSELEPSGLVRRLLRLDEAFYPLLRVLISDMTEESQKKLETVAAGAGKK